MNVPKVESNHNQIRDTDQINNTINYTESQTYSHTVQGIKGLKLLHSAKDFWPP